MKISVKSAMLAVAVIFAGGLLASYWWPNGDDMPVPDHLCNTIRTQFPGMECVQTLVSSALMKPGAEVEMIGAPNARRVDIPRADLFGETCRVPGAPATAISGETFQREVVAIPELRFNVNRKLKVGAELPLPKVQGLTLTAGPEWSDVSSARFKTEKTTIVQIDENLAANVLNNCYVKLECVERAIKSKYRIVSGAIVAEHLDFALMDEKNRVLALDAKAKAINASFGGRSDVRAEAGATLRVTSPTTLAVRFIPEEIVNARLTSACLEAIKFLAEGTAATSVAGAGGRGNIGTGASSTKPLGEEALAEATGTEASECRADSGRTISQGRARGKVEAVGASALRFSYELLAQGGHYRTAAGCAFGEPVGLSGHDNGTTASVDLHGAIRVVVRAPKVHLMTLKSSLPGDALVAVRDAEGKEVKAIILDPKEKRPGAPPPSDPNAKTYRLIGPAVYVVEASLRLNRVVSGAAGKERRQEAREITVSVAE